MRVRGKWSGGNFARTRFDFADANQNGVYGPPYIGQGKKATRLPPSSSSLLIWTSMSARSITRCRGVRGISSTPLCHVSSRRSVSAFTAGSTRPYSGATPGQDPLPQQNDLSLASARDSGASCRERSVLLTGGTSGIGLAVAEQLVKAGAGRVLIPTRDADRGLQAIERIKSSTGLEDVPVSTLTVDVTNRGDVQGPISQAIKQMVNMTR